MRNILKANSIMLGAALLLSVGLVGCTQTQTTRDDSMDRGIEQHQDNVALETGGTDQGNTGRWGRYSPKIDKNHSMSAMAFPTGDPNTSALLVHQVMPKEVHKGQPFDLSYHVTNLTNSELQNVMVLMQSASNMDISGSEPSGTKSDAGMNWALGDLGAGQTRVIKLNASAGKVGVASDCITVSYNNFLCASVNVVEPALTLTKSATSQALSCDEIVLRYTVKNSGTGSANNVTIKDTLPEGLAMSDGSRSISIPVGTLTAGESKAYEVRTRASRAGEYSSPASATADGGLKASAEATKTVVNTPVLAVDAQCGDNQFLGRNFTFNYTIENTGDGVANNATASALIPSGTTVVRSSDAGRVVGNNVVWDFGTLKAGAKKTFSMTVSASTIGKYSTTVTGNANCAESVADTCSTSLEGIPAILLEVVDLVDPVEVGGQTTYVITVTNQGSAPDTNIRIVTTLPAEQSFVSASGATNGTAQGKKVTFAPASSLAPGATISWRVTVKAESEADSRFRVEMTSDRLTTPVIETEATNLYK